MTRTQSRILFEIPDDWTQEQAYAVYQVLNCLRAFILSHYGAQIIDGFREQHMLFEPAKPDPIPDDCSYEFPF
jgi:hypothetical protein